MSGSKACAYTHHTMMIRRYLVSALPTFCILILIGGWFSGLQAADKHPASSESMQSTLDLVLHESGIHQLYKDVVENVLQESHLARLTCDDSVDKAENVQRFLRQWLNVDQLMRESEEHLFRQLEPSMIGEVAEWMRSAPGQRILQAEMQSAEWSDDEFTQRELALASSPDWNESRQELIGRALSAAGTVRFVTALHSESSALVLQAGDCLASTESQALVNRRIEQTRAEEGFYSVFLSGGVLRTAGMIFSEISNADVEAYLAHSQSAAGKAWNDALLEMIRQVLRERHVPMQTFLADITSD